MNHFNAWLLQLSGHDRVTSDKCRTCQAATMHMCRQVPTPVGSKTRKCKGNDVFNG
jgi:hypothetical protein